MRPRPDRHLKISIVHRIIRSLRRTRAHHHRHRQRTLQHRPRRRELRPHRHRPPHPVLRRTRRINRQLNTRRPRIRIPQSQTGGSNRITGQGSAHRQLIRLPRHVVIVHPQGKRPGRGGSEGARPDRNLKSGVVHRIVGSLGRARRHLHRDGHRPLPGNRTVRESRPHPH